MSENFSRRSFLGSLAAAGAVSLTAGAAQAQVTEVPSKWDKTVDFLIVGTGFAGLAAAIEGHEQGIKNILVIDKMPTYGGNSIINGGAVAAAGTEMQKAAGIKDSPDLLFKDIMKAGGGLAHPQLARHIADSSVENFGWLKKVGVQFKAVTFHGGHSVPRSHAVTNNSGSGFINPMYKKCQEYGVPVQLRTIVDELVVDPKTGAVLGAKVRENYRFGREKSGKVAYYRATKGVLLAAGGFSQNVKMRMNHDPRLNEKFGSTNHPGATGEALQAAQMIGANTIQMDWIQLGPWTSPDEKGFGVAPLFVEPAVGYGLMIDPATGKRFIQETGNRKVRADAIVAIGHPTLIYIGVKNAENKIIGKNMTPELFDRAIKSGVVKKVANLKELADTYKVPYEQLKKTNETFDGYIKAQKDPDFNCMMFKDAVPNGDGPFYVCRLWPRVHHCMGGLVINDKAQVENARGNVIPGLYAAGEITGGVHGMVRLGTVAVADCIIFGRTAARTIAGK